MPLSIYNDLILMNGKAEESGICNELWRNKLIVTSSPNEKRPPPPTLFSCLQQLRNSWNLKTATASSASSFLPSDLEFLKDNSKIKWGQNLEQCWVVAMLGDTRKSLQKVNVIHLKEHMQMFSIAQHWPSRENSPTAYFPQCHSGQ